MIEIEDTDHRTLTYMERSITEVRLTSCLDGFDQRSKSVITSKTAESKRVIRKVTQAVILSSISEYSLHRPTKAYRQMDKRDRFCEAAGY